MTKAQQLAQDALALSPDERLEVIGLIEASLAGEMEFDWTAELDRRIARLDSGASATLSATDAIAEMKQELANRIRGKMEPVEFITLL
ncbi:addiction module protein [Planctomicrobium piriforme]|uniref:Putative addiction module component, TIGR02574 family n=1 Tax=Planctomicrobium piriforme TaxID=1576369 RepID=A0A1I3PWY8_9PLAN|nr:addiction module protein [Planctomicrobium piriforme]SFJ25777.1 putative addiction module component, TIGR02574 family [Planctomicrobium piriforme]